jgi:hypothetical protein
LVLTCFYSSTSKASPNDAEIVIVIIIIGEAKLKFHGGGIIAQSFPSSAGRDACQADNLRSENKCRGGTSLW